MKGLRVGHVLSSLGVGGQERVALDLATCQRAAGCEVLAVSLAGHPEGPLAGEFRARGIGVRIVRRAPGIDLRLPGQLASLFRNERLDVVHTHNPQPLIYGAVAARIAGARCVHTKHGANPDRALRIWLRRAAARFTSAYVAVSASTAEIARRNREVDPRKLVVIENGIDLMHFKPNPESRASVRAELGLPADAWLAITVGRLSPEKDQGSLIDAIAPLLGPAARLLVVGGGPEAARLAARKGGQNVHFLGARRDVARLLAASDLFALSSVTEGMPLAILEAMATGLPVVSTAVGGIPSLVDHGTSGLLVPAADAGALGAALERVRKDPILAGALGARALEHARSRHSAERMAERYLALYTRSLGSRAAARLAEKGER